MVDEKELRILKILVNNDTNNIGISKLYKENDIIKIVAGHLLGLEGQIIKYVELIKWGTVII